MGSPIFFDKKENICEAVLAKVERIWYNTINECIEYESCASVAVEGEEKGAMLFL